MCAVVLPSALCCQADLVLVRLLLNFSANIDTDIYTGMPCIEVSFGPCLVEAAYCQATTSSGGRWACL
jgi:hypothetical protein